MAEYYGKSDEMISSVVIRQFKHSTLNPDGPLTLAEASGILRKFADLDDPKGSFSTRHSGAELSYSIVTNRPISQKLEAAVSVLVSGQTLSPDAVSLVKRVGRNESALRALCTRLELKGNEVHFRALRPELNSLANEYSSDQDHRVTAQLLDLVAQHAGTGGDGVIKRADVLQAFGVEPGELYPAPAMFKEEPYIVREAYRDLVEKIMGTYSPTIVCAEGGVGKSTFARSLPEILGERGEVVLYDCFGNGTYRRTDQSRHRYRDALVQIGAELAGKGLCLPILPGNGVEKEEYLKVFLRRLQQAATIMSGDVTGVLVIVVDAADNSVIAARQNAEASSFAKDLLRLSPDLPKNVRIVLTCRPERLSLLAPPADVVMMSLPPFSMEELAARVRQDFPEASRKDIAELEVRTAGNPRLVDSVLANASSIGECLLELAGFSRFPDGVIDGLLSRRFREAREDSGEFREQLDQLAQALTLLRPRVPLLLLEQITGMPSRGIRSFVSDMGRGLRISEDHLEFLDEPTETYFYQNHKAKQSTVTKAVEVLTDLAESSTYAAQSLPEVLWSACKYEELLTLVTGEQSLPMQNRIIRSEVEKLRVEFGLRAAIQLERFDVISELAMKAGSLHAGQERRYDMILRNPDLAALALDLPMVHELLAARRLPQDWPGATIGAEAALLAYCDGHLPMARNRARLAVDMLEARVRADSQVSAAGHVRASHLSWIFLSLLRTDGVVTATRYLMEDWSQHFLLEASMLAANILVRHGEVATLNALIAVIKDPAVVLVFFGQAQKTGLPLSCREVSAAWDIVRDAPPRLRKDRYDLRDINDCLLGGISYLASEVCKHGLSDTETVRLCLRSYLKELPKLNFDRHFGPVPMGRLLLIALLAELEGKPLFAGTTDNLIDGRQGKASAELKQGAGQLPWELKNSLPWLTAWSKLSLGNLGAKAAATILDEYPRGGWGNRDVRIETRILHSIAPLIARSFEDEVVSQRFINLVEHKADSRPVYLVSSLIGPLRGDPRFTDLAIDLAHSAKVRMLADHQPIEEVSDLLVDISRDLYLFDKHESAAYFAQVVDLTSRVGYETGYRWRALLTLVGAARGIGGSAGADLARRTWSLAEAIMPLIDDQFDEQELARSLSELYGPYIFQLVAIWLDRNVGRLDRLLAGAVEGVDMEGLSAAVLAPFLPTNFHCDAELVGTKFDVQEEEWLQLERRFIENYGVVFGGSELMEGGDNQIESRSISLRWVENGSGSATIESCRVALRKLDLVTAKGADAAAQLLRNASIYDLDILSSLTFEYPASKWGIILERIVLSKEYSTHARADYLNIAFRKPRRSASFSAALMRVTNEFSQAEATSIYLGATGLDFVAASSVLEISLREYSKLLLKHLNLDEVLLHAHSCYGLAKAVARTLDANEAAKVSGSSLRLFERDIGDLVTVLPEFPPQLNDFEAIAGFLWTALANPKQSIRWRATHAVRIAVELQASAIVDALMQLAMKDDHEHFVEPHFHFYQMSATEYLLIAIRRAVHHSNRVISTTAAQSIHRISEKYPDHFMIQHHAHLIATAVLDAGSVQAGTDWEREFLSPLEIDRFDRPRAIPPFSIGAAQTEFPFDIDFEQGTLIPLAEAFGLEYQTVLEKTNAIILDEWRWRGDPMLDQDPRHAASIYESGDTWFRKGETPKADDLRYYLERHAALTVAGRLAREEHPHRSPHHSQLDIIEWMTPFDISRSDELWISDLKFAVPETMRPLPGRAERAWISDLQESDYFSVLGVDSGWITVWQAARNSNAYCFETVDVVSSLVNREASDALLRTLASGGSYMQYRLPTVEDKDFEFDDAPFQLQAWISVPHTEEGIDRLDPFANGVPLSIPEPAQGFIESLKVKGMNGDTVWVDQEGNVVLKCESWSDSRGEAENGVSGSRLQIKDNVLDALLDKEGKALTIEVKFYRTIDSRYDPSVQGDEEGSIGRYYRVYSYEPGAGWTGL